VSVPGSQNLPLREQQGLAVAPSVKPANAVRLAGVCKTYAARGAPVEALSDISLDCAHGEFVTLLGPSGCGKSTLLLMIAGLVPATAGQITIFGERVTKPYTELGIVFQDPVLLEWRKVLRNVLLQSEIRGLPKQESLARARRLLEQVGLAGFEDRYPYELSGGMRQRVAICRALLHDPPLLMMDEPFGALDALTRDQLNLDMQKLWLEAPKTVFFVTHSISEAVFLGSKVVVMTPGPGRIAEILDVDLPRPRPLEMRETPEFGTYTQEIRRLFSSLGILRDNV
jgi:NitT/TauT family transport system ATP-binding protein